MDLHELLRHSDLRLPLLRWGHQPLEPHRSAAQMPREARARLWGPVTSVGQHLLV